MEKGIILGSNNLPEFEGFPVRDEIERRLGTPVIPRKRRQRRGAG